jgi:ABC-type phosphate transport system permease subunit
VRQRLEERVQRAIERLTLFRAVRMVAVVALTLALVAGVVEWLVDPAMGNLRDALWWAIVTVTTVGYGDVVPTSTAGRLVGSVLMIAGVSAIPITTSLVVSVFVNRAQTHQRQLDAKQREELMARLERIEQALTPQADTR